VEALPKEFHLSRSHLDKFDLLGELRGIKGSEDCRHRSYLLTGDPPKFERKSFNPLGAPPPGESRHQTPGGPWAQATSSARPATGVESKEEAPKRRSGPKAMELQSDPTELPNEYVQRYNLIEAAITAQKKHLDACRSDSALLKLQGPAMDWSPPSMKWDRLPTANGTGHTENQSKYFPRSLERSRECGVYKEPKACRPYDNVYRFREMMIMQKQILTKH